MTHSNDIIKIARTHRNYTSLLVFSVMRRSHFSYLGERIIYS